MRGQSPTTGTLSGAVMDTAGLPLNEVLVTLTDQASGASRTAVTARTGTFSFSFLYAGEYRIELEKIGYAPRRVTDIPVRPGRAVQMEATLPSVMTASPEWVVDHFDGAALRGGRAGATQWLSARLSDLVPTRRRAATELAGLTSAADEQLQIEGTPAWFSMINFDGTAFRPAMHPELRSSMFRMTGIPQSAVASGMLVSNGVDVEWPAAGGGILSLNTHGGADSLRFDAFAKWAGDALPGSSIDAPFTDIQAGARLRGALFADSAGFSVGVDIRRLKTPHSAAVEDNTASDRLLLAAQNRTIDLSALRAPAALADQAASAFARLGWAVSPRHRLDASLSFSSMPSFGVVDRSTGRVSDIQGADLIAGFSLRSSLRSSIDNELRAGFTSSRRETVESTGLPATTLIDESFSFGGGGQRARGEQSVLHASEALHLRGGGHALKVGAKVELTNYSFEQRQRLGGEYLFGGIGQFEADSGVFVGTEGPAPVTKWSTPRLGVFAQDHWAPGEGLDVLFGVLADREALPSEGVSRDIEWARLTGIANDTVLADKSSFRISPSVAVTWDVRREHRWIVHVGGSVAFERVDPLLLSEWQSDDGDVDVRRVVGRVVWPSLTAGSGTRAQHLTLLTPGFTAPVSARFGGGLMYRATAGTAVHLSGALRSTDNLPRRRDLNVLPQPAARDQYDRPVYGVLVKQGGLLAAQPGSNRRFSDYDEVAAITSDGSSRYWGVTAGVEHDLVHGLAATLRYTFSSTTDDWLGGADGGWNISLPQGLTDAGDWADAVSDFDVPQRFAAGLVYDAPFNIIVSSRFRRESGPAFTPGFRTGVDANADGSGRNDPAFIDDALPGMSAIISSWPCLRESAGQFARRNACRAPAVNTVDLGLSVRVARLAGMATSITLDAFDLLDDERIVPDAALYLVDPAAELTRNQAARTISVPLVPNETFGQPLTRRHTGRQLRLGVTLNW